MQKPANPKLYAIIVAQAKAKYSSYPNPGASHWVHKTYVNHGGQFVETTEADRRKGLAKKKAENEARKKTEVKKHSKESEKKKGKR